MKVLDPDRADWLLRRGRAIAAKQSKQARRRKHVHNLERRAGYDHRVPHRPTSVLRLPSSLVAERSVTRAAINSTLRTLLDRLEHTPARVKLDFTMVTRIFPGGMLILLAHLELLTELYPGRIRAVCNPGSMAAQLIRHFGFGTRLQVPSNGNTPRHSSVTGWRFATGKLTEGDRIQQHIADFAQQVMSDLPDGLYNVLVEAMINVRHHAYPDHVKVPESLQRWWMFSKSTPPRPGEPGQLYLAFYDIGIGIQESLRRNLHAREKMREGYEQVLSLLGIGTGKGQDTDLLRVAVEHTRTSTGLPFRGKGLPEMKEFASSTTGGQMTIISGHAQYSLRANSEPASVTRCDQAILGTLILWNLPLIWKEATP